MKKRDINIECLRAVACVAVILLHVNAWCFELDKIDGGAIKATNVIINTVVRFAVPCFMLVTGKYVFRNIEINGLKYFYKRTIKRVLVPTFCFSIMYVVYTVAKGILDNEWVLKEEIYNWFKGIPFGHMWYMYMLIGFYAVVPVLAWLRNHVDYSIWGTIGIACILLDFIFYNGNLIAPYWLFCWIQYVGYFILGDFAGGGKAKSKNISALAWIAGIISLVAMCWYSLKIMKTGIRYDFQPQNILTAVYSLSLFIVFDKLEINKIPMIIEKIAKQSANIYYIHGLIVNMMVIIMNRFGLQYTFPVLFLVFTLSAVLIISYVGGVCVDNIVLLLRKIKGTL